MHVQTVLLLALAAAALARPDYSYDAPSTPSPLYGAPTHPTTPSHSYSSPSHTSRPSHHSSSYNSHSDTGYSYNDPSDTGYSYKEPRQGPAQYDTQYVVSDTESGNNFGQQETRDGDVVSGTYYVELPDGRLQVVTYTVSEETGYVAEVTYEGQTTTAAPSSKYGTPSSTYDKPSSTYGKPSSTYGKPSSIYDTPSSGYA